ncbi:Cationic amino acid transporter 2, partial [Pseudolycoriella hygida]
MSSEFVGSPSSDNKDHVLFQPEDDLHPDNLIETEDQVLDQNFDKLKRLELPNIGISTTFGIGIFVIIGFVARNIAGPSVIVCITVAALISFLSGTFYAELSSRITKNASTYTYVYVCIGELQAFIVGWTIILEYVIGVAIVSESIGLHVDTLLNNTIKNSFKEFAPMHWSALGTYFDFIGFSIPIFFAIIVNIGLKRSEFLNKLFAVISVAIMLFIVIAGAFRAERSNWYTIPDPLLTNLNAGVGGFAPFEYFGILRGVAVCIFIFIGLEITGTGTRWKSLYGTLSFVFGTVSMIGVGTVVTLALPFYLLNEHAQLPQIFNIPSWYTAYWIIAIGGIIVLFASMYGLMFSMQITVLAMAKDSLLPKSFDSDKHTKPIIEILCAGLIAGLLAGLFEMAHLIDMLSIGIIFGFMATAFAVVMF